jgi:diadenosine tetraphosphate (Ap4A) HIT family hydrolase
MSTIYESENFSVISPDKPLIDRADGGHIIIFPKMSFVDRQQLNPKQAIELMRLTMVVGRAMTTVMNEHGFDIGRINYQDNGNWAVFKPKGPHLHVHLYGRAKSAKIQLYGQACKFPHIEEQPEFYKDLEPLNEEDIKDIKTEIELLLKKDKYSDSEWGLS